MLSLWATALSLGLLFRSSRTCRGFDAKLSGDAKRASVCSRYRCHHGRISCHAASKLTALSRATFSTNGLSARPILPPGAPP